MYTVAITTQRDEVVDDREREQRTRRRVPPGATSASTPSANAVSVDIAAPQPCAPEPPALKAR